MEKGNAIKNSSFSVLLGYGLGNHVLGRVSSSSSEVVSGQIICMITVEYLFGFKIYFFQKRGGGGYISFVSTWKLTVEMELSLNV